MKKLTSANYKQDQLYPVVVRAVAEILETGDVVAPVEVFFYCACSGSQTNSWKIGGSAGLDISNELPSGDSAR